MGITSRRDPSRPVPIPFSAVFGRARARGETKITKNHGKIRLPPPLYSLLRSPQGARGLVPHPHSMRCVCPCIWCCWECCHFPTNQGGGSLSTYPRPGLLGLNNPPPLRRPQPLRRSPPSPPLRWFLPPLQQYYYYYYRQRQQQQPQPQRK